MKKLLLLGCLFLSSFNTPTPSKIVFTHLQRSIATELLAKYGYSAPCNTFLLGVCGKKQVPSINPHIDATKHISVYAAKKNPENFLAMSSHIVYNRTTQQCRGKPFPVIENCTADELETYLKECATREFWTRKMIESYKCTSYGSAFSGLSRENL